MPFMSNGSIRRTTLGVAAALVLTLASPLAAHELADASATLVVRDGGHVQLRLQIPWADVLRSSWMPARSTPEFLVIVANQPRADFARQFATVERQIQQRTRLVADAAAPVTFTRWQGASAAEVQDALKRELMSRLADGDRFEHASRLAITAELTTGRELSTVRLQLPASLGPALVTVYRPEEHWTKAGELSSPVNVARPPTAGAAPIK